MSKPRPPKPPSDAEWTVLRSIARRRCAHLSQWVDAGTIDVLPPEDRAALREAVGDELCNLGFDDDEEPNTYGLLLERLIDFLAPVDWYS